MEFDSLGVSQYICGLFFGLYYLRSKGSSFLSSVGI